MANARVTSRHIRGCRVAAVMRAGPMESNCASLEEKTYSRRSSLMAGCPSCFHGGER